MSVELTIMHELQSWFVQPSAKTFVIICARWLIFVLPILVLGGWKLGYLKRHACVEVLWTTLLASLLAFAGEVVLARTRPFIVDPSLNVLVSRPHTMSFPSAHASISYAIAFMLLGWNARLGIAAVILADLVAFGRVAAGVHYPTDVLAGLLVGFMSFMIVRFGHAWTSLIKTSPSSLRRG